MEDSGHYGSPNLDGAYHGVARVVVVDSLAFLVIFLGCKDDFDIVCLWDGQVLDREWCVGLVKVEVFNT